MFSVSRQIDVATDQYINTAQTPCRLGDPGCNVGW
jgi:hypothetical protein